MATSAQKGVILYDYGDLDTDESLDTVFCRDEVVQTACHKADEAAQVRGAWTAIHPDRLNDPEYLQPFDTTGALELATGSRDKWYPLAVVSFAPKIRAGQTGYRLRVRLWGASSAGDSVDFAASVAPFNAGEMFRFEGVAGTGSAYPFKVVSNITSTTAAELTLDDATAYLDVSAELISEALALSSEWSMPTDIGGTPSTIAVPLLKVIVWGQTWAAPSAPLLYGYSVADYIGP